MHEENSNFDVGVAYWLDRFIPSLIFALAVMALLGPGLLNVFVALGFTNWSYTCRITRSQALSARTLDYVKAARALGYDRIRIMFSQIGLRSCILVIVVCPSTWLRVVVSLSNHLTFGI